MLWLWLCVAVPFGPLASACVAIPWPCVALPFGPSASACVALPFGPSASACVALPWPCFCSHSRHSDKVTCLTELTMAWLALPCLAHCLLTSSPKSAHSTNAKEVSIQCMPKTCPFNGYPNKCLFKACPRSVNSTHAKDIPIEQMPNAFPRHAHSTHAEEVPMACPTNCENT
ncbi:hypothetical protein GBA52_015002 [Prunus armeniaca]|nr:hypothetical protein GBA52_015002 [Prunus armeniaca]